MHKWFYPGMRVKRWLALLVIGIVLVSLALAMTSAWVYRTLDLPYPVTAFVQGLTLQFIPHPGRELVIGLPGLALAIFASFQLSCSLLAAILPTETAGQGLPLAERVYAARYAKRGPRIVAIGGGTGLSTMLRGLKRYTSNLTAILTVGDDGGSSGRLRRDLGILPPGDFRNCIIALADREPLMAELFQYRFPDGSGAGLDGHSFGNLFIVAMLGLTGNFEQAVTETSRVLAVRGQVLPSTLANVTLCAETGDGAIIIGESAIPEARTGLKRVFLQPAHPPGYPEALRAILDADLVVLGPGSLYTSILPNLLVEDLVDMLHLTNATKVFVCNVATQRGETDHFTVADHVNALVEHVGDGIFDYVLVNNTFDHVDKIKAEWQVQPVGQGEWPRYLHGARLLLADVVSPQWPLRHDPDKLASQLLRLWQDDRQQRRSRRVRSEAALPVPR